MAQYPPGFGPWLQALANALSKPREIATVGHPTAADTQALLTAVRDGYRPFHVVALGEPAIDYLQLAQPRQLPSTGADRVGSTAAVPLLQDRGMVDGQAAAYVCRDSKCQAPVAEPGGLLAQLE